MRLSNRVGALLLLLAVIGVLVGGYLYFYVYFVSTLKITSNLSGYTVDLYAPSVAQTFSHECQQTGCTISDISPFEYIMTVKKEGYIDVVKTLDLKGAKTLGVEIELKKMISVEVLQDTEQSVGKQEKIDFLKIKAKAFATFDEGDLGIFYFDDNKDRLELSRSFSGITEKISNFNAVEASQISLSRVLPQNTELIITVGTQNYLYDTVGKNLKQIDLNIPVKYAKNGEFLGEYQLVTEKGTYLYYKTTGKIEYSSIFYDYIYAGEGQYIGYIAGDDIQRRKNFSFEGEPEGKPLLVFYDQNTFKKEVFYRLENNIIKIYKKADKYIILDTSGAQLELKGL